MKGKCLGGPTTITVVLTATLVIICTSCQIPPEPPEPRANKIYEAKCTSVIDGDTIRVSMRKTSSDGITYKALVKVRLVGIDTPEIKYSKGSRRRRRSISRTPQGSTGIIQGVIFPHGYPSR